MDLRGLSIKIPKYSKVAKILQRITIPLDLILFLFSSYSPPIHTHFSRHPHIIRGKSNEGQEFSHIHFIMFLSSLFHLIFKIFRTLLPFSYSPLHYNTFIVNYSRNSEENQNL